MFNLTLITMAVKTNVMLKILIQIIIMFLFSSPCKNITSQHIEFDN